MLVFLLHVFSVWKGFLLVYASLWEICVIFTVLC